MQRRYGPSSWARRWNTCSLLPSGTLPIRWRRSCLCIAIPPLRLFDVYAGPWPTLADFLLCTQHRVGDAVTKTAPVEIVRRRVAIDFDPVPAGPWYPPANHALETVLNAMSLTFPAGERYFIDSVRAYSDRISDPELRKEVRDFIYQEAMHNKVHVDCNAMLARHNPRAALIEKGATVVFRVLRYRPGPFVYRSRARSSTSARWRPIRCSIMRRASGRTCHPRSLICGCGMRPKRPSTRPSASTCCAM